MITLLECEGGFLSLAERERGLVENTKHLVLQTERMALAREMRERGIPFETADAIYDAAQDYETLCQQVGQAVLREADCVFVSMGELLFNRAALYILREANRRGIPTEISARAADCAALRALAGQPECAFTSVVRTTARAFAGRRDTEAVLVVSEVETAACASDLKLPLGVLYGDEKQVWLFHGTQGKQLPLYELDRETGFSVDSRVVVLPEALLERKRYSAEDLVGILKRLRGPQGCPWDREQTHESLRQYLVEESYEAIQAVNDGDTDALYDELGDVLLQVAFHACIAEEYGEFTYEDIPSAVCRKMIQRHTHIFGDQKADTPAEVMRNWEAVKKQEKRHETYSDVLKDVCRALPALMSAYKVQKKAGNFGFDWPDASGAFAKLEEELSELKEAADQEHREEELGDLLFSVVNVARKLDIQPEIALNKTVDKFIGRFSDMEKAACAKGQDLAKLPLEELDRLWEQAKVKAHKE